MRDSCPRCGAPPEKIAVCNCPGSHWMECTACKFEWGVKDGRLFNAVPVPSGTETHSIREGGS